MLDVLQTLLLYAVFKKKNTQQNKMHLHFVESAVKWRTSEATGRAPISLLLWAEVETGLCRLRNKLAFN